MLRQIIEQIQCCSFSQKPQQLTYNIPSRVQSDQGLENIEVGRFMIRMQRMNRGSIITGNSVHNQRIERLWREVDRVVVSRFLNIFLFLESNGAFNPDNEMHLYCLHALNLCRSLCLSPLMTSLVYFLPML